jgi:flagellar hook protein FlgE
MGITSSLVTGLSGLSANQSKLDVVGNNIANVNTVAFKASRLDFKSQFSQTFSFGSAPEGDLGGTNPMQVGLGTVQGAISRNFNSGSQEVTGVTSNLMVEGDGFFVVSDGGQYYTRDGTFKLNSLNELVNSDGMHVQGFGVDASYNVVPGVLTDLTVPLGSLTLAEATQNVVMQGNLNGSGPLPTSVANLTMNQAFFVTNGTGGVTGTAPTAATPLTQLTNATGTPYFNATDVLSLTGQVGTASVATKTLDVGTSTLGDLLNFFNGTMGINTTAGANGSIATTPGASLATTATTPAGAITLSLDGNPGTANNLTLDTNSFTVTSGTVTSTPFTWTQNAVSDGESIATTATVYDSLGTALTVNLTAALVDKTSTGSIWRFYATSPDGSGTGVNTQSVVGTGTLNFDTQGRLVSSTTPTVTIDRSNTGANPNFTFNIDFGGVFALTDSNSEWATNDVDGSKKGTLVKYSIEQSGLITGTFDNGLKRTLGQVALATFKNNQGLVDKGSNLFEEGPNSGTAVISAPGDFTAGRIVSGALELSNVDLSSEFVQLISASTGFSASSRVITTSNQLLQELLNAAR